MTMKHGFKGLTILSSMATLALLVFGALGYFIGNMLSIAYQNSANKTVQKPTPRATHYTIEPIQPTSSQKIAHSGSGCNCPLCCPKQ